jgi:hypothetical protein
MGHFQKTGTFSAHDNAINAAEAVRQVAVAAAAQSPAGQVAVNNAEIAFHRAVLASCKANNTSQGASESLMALKALGVNS